MGHLDWSSISVSKELFKKFKFCGLNDRTEKVFFSILKKICYGDDLDLIGVN